MDGAAINLSQERGLGNIFISNIHPVILLQENLVK
jgi:hypothetical protein